MRTDYKKVESKKDLLEIIETLLAEDATKWKNVSAPAFLEAMAAWLESADNFYKNFDLDTNSENASWQLFADAIKAAVIYE